MFPTKEMRANLAYMHARDDEGNLQERDHLYRAPFFADTPEKQKAAFQPGGAGLFARPKEYASKWSRIASFLGVLRAYVWRHVYPGCKSPERPRGCATYQSTVSIVFLHACLQAPCLFGTITLNKALPGLDLAELTFDSRDPRGFAE
jgi:hypothetical protein